ncbi:MAG: hypothetical protein IPL28_17555 [Chloroflexi bacterium]|nr:hypothetical protein [Chloroflexota bacterium]
MKNPSKIDQLLDLLLDSLQERQEARKAGQAVSLSASQRVSLSASQLVSQKWLKPLLRTNPQSKTQNPKSKIPLLFSQASNWGR